jgi:acetate kinase
LIGISGVSNDMRALQESDEPRAQEAIDYFLYRVGQSLGALAASLGGLDGLVFTAGIGENDAATRARVCQDAAWLGARIDPMANERRDLRISVEDSTPSVWVIPTDEERMIAMHTFKLVGV